MAGPADWATWTPTVPPESEGAAAYGRRVTLSPQEPQGQSPLQSVVKAQASSEGKSAAPKNATYGKVESWGQGYIKETRSNSTAGQTGENARMSKLPKDPPPQAMQSPAICWKSYTPFGCSRRDCKYEHPPVPAGYAEPPRAPGTTLAPHPLYKTQLCGAFLEGLCTQADRCRYIHADGPDIHLLMGRYFALTPCPYAKYHGHCRNIACHFRTHYPELGLALGGLPNTTDCQPIPLPSPLPKLALCDPQVRP